MNHISDTRVGTAIDLDKFRLRNFIDRLVEANEVEVISERIELGNAAARMYANPKAVYFKNVGNDGMELVGNVMASRRRLALAFGVEESAVLQTIVSRMNHLIPPVEISSKEAPAHEVVLTGSDADFTKLPVNLQHEFDAAPYISASLDFATLPSGGTNVGCRRMMLRGRREAGVDLNAPSDLRALYLAAAGKGEKLPVAFVVGSHPADFIASCVLVPPGDELALMGAIRGEAVPVVRCKTIDVLVAADAEYVLEGYLDEAGFDEPEGPYGEFLGYYGLQKKNPVFHLTAVTHRKNALFQTATISGHILGCTDNAQLVALRTEAAAWAALQNAIREPVAVYANPNCGGMFNLRVSMRTRFNGEARNAISAVLGSTADVKHVYVMDDDIDVFSDQQFEWALATRFQADRDLQIVSGHRTMPLDPSLRGRKTGAKAGFDLTVPKDDVGASFVVPKPPQFAAGRAVSPAGGVRATLGKGAATFKGLMDAIGTSDGREVLLELEDLRAERRLVHQTDGRYALLDNVPAT